MAHYIQRLFSFFFVFFLFFYLAYGASPKSGLYIIGYYKKDNKYDFASRNWGIHRANLNEKTKKYYQFINRAARAIYKNDFLSASACYDSAFLFKKNPYYQDIKNSILVNYKTGCSEKNDANIKMLFELKRVDTAFLFSQLPKRVFSGANLKYINVLLQKSILKKQKTHPFDTPLRAMFIADQKAHGFEGFNMSDRAEAQEAFATRAGVDHENLIQFYNLYKQFGFPTEEKMGIQYDKDRDWSDVISILLIHFVASKDMGDLKLVLSIIQTNLENGNIHPAVYAKLCEYLHSESKKAEYNFMQTMLCQVNEVFYRPFVFYSDSLMKEVNTNRVSIGLDSFHIAQRHAVCQHIGSKNLKTQYIIHMMHSVEIDVLSYGFVKYAFDQAKMDMESYRIRSEKILKECKCEEKTY